MGLLRVGHDLATSFSLVTFIHWRRKWQPTLYSCLEKPMDREAQWATVHRVKESWTRLSAQTHTPKDKDIHIYPSTIIRKATKEEEKGSRQR